MDPYFKKTIEYDLYKNHFTFDVANTIFSTFNIDIGSQLLLRTISANEGSTLLDIGCGYGVLGIVLSKLLNTSKITMVDKDLLSLKYARVNVEKNKVGNAELIGSVGLENVPEYKYDLIVSNIPAKIGDEAIEKEFILKPMDYLSKDGTYWFVVVTALNRLIPSIGLKHNLDLKQVVKRNRYAVYRLKNSK
jgi:16S rRNA (guanine1207-N2)-methyltransferase